MRCLLDKVVARTIMQGLLKLQSQQPLTETELFSLDLFGRASQEGIELFIVPPTAQLLTRLQENSAYTFLINRFLKEVQVIQPTRYFKRWARRLRDDYSFSQEDAAVLALGTFSTNITLTILGMHVITTLDRPMMQQWSDKQELIQKRLQRMQTDIVSPYNQTALPKLQRPAQVINKD